METDFQCTITKIKNGWLLFNKNMINGKFEYNYFENSENLMNFIKKELIYLK